MKPGLLDRGRWPDRPNHHTEQAMVHGSRAIGFSPVSKRQQRREIAVGNFGTGVSAYDAGPLLIGLLGEGE
jgi:hypothetical protein